MKLAHSLRLKVTAVSTACILLLSVQPASAATLFTTMSSSGIAYGFTYSVIGISPITIPGATTVQTIEMKIASGNGSGSKVEIFADNSGSPAATAIGTLTYTSFTSPNALLSGSVYLPSAGKYWFKFSTLVSYSNYYSMTPVTTGSLSGWSIGRMLESTNSGASYTLRSDNLVYLMNINGTGGIAPIASSISISANQSGTYRQISTVSASLGVAGSDGRVTFYANGKRIAGCINLLSTSLSASCSWKPSTRGALALTARLVPTNSAYLPSISNAASIKVMGRTNNR
jgi:hypothetical protein